MGFIWPYKKFGALDPMGTVSMCVKILAIFCSFIWDIYMDFGLWRFWEKGDRRWGLRKDILFPVWWYWAAIVLNFVTYWGWIGTNIAYAISSEY